MSATSTITAVENLTDVSDLDTPEACISAAELLTRNYMWGMARILYAWVYVHEHGTREEFAKRFDKSIRSVQRLEKVLRDHEVIEAAPPRGKHATVRATSGASVENSTPTPTTQHCDPVQTPTPTSVLPDTEVGDDHGQLVECTVYTPEEDSEAYKDYERCLEHVDAIIKLTKKYFKSGWEPQWWSNISGELGDIQQCCEWHCADVRERTEAYVRERIR